MGFKSEEAKLAVVVLKRAAHANVQTLLSTYTYARYEVSRRSRKKFLVFPFACSFAVMSLYDTMFALSRYYSRMFYVHQYI